MSAPARTVAVTAFSPSRWPSIRGRPRCVAQRPLPSMMIATFFGMSRPSTSDMITLQRISSRWPGDRPGHPVRPELSFHPVLQHLSHQKTHLQRGALILTARPLSQPVGSHPGQQARAGGTDPDQLAGVDEPARAAIAADKSSQPQGEGYVLSQLAPAVGAAADHQLESLGPHHLVLVECRDEPGPGWVLLQQLQPEEQNVVE